MRVLVYAETQAGAVTGVTKELISAARALAGDGGSVDLALIAAEASVASGLDADRILLAGGSTSPYNPAVHQAAVEAIVAAEKPDLVLLAYNTAGLDIGPYVAIRKNLPLISYCTAVRVAEDRVEVDSQVYGGKLVATASATLPAVLLVNPGAYRESEGATASAEIVSLPVDDTAPAGISLLRSIEPDPKAVDITKSDLLLCVGRGIGDQNAIEEAREAAELLGAELVGSRPIVDAGWLPKERQVGKSGRKVKPRLYLAVGVSGAPEHLEGMAASGTIVAINSDPKAPIFDHAHFGATVDAADFISALSARLAK